MEDLDGDEAHTPPENSTKPHGLSMATELESEPDQNDNHDNNRLCETSVTMDSNGSCPARTQDGSSTSKVTGVPSSASQANDGIGMNDLGERSAPNASAAVAAALETETTTSTKEDVEGKIRGLLSKIPLDSEKLRNIAWEAGGYQVHVGGVMSWHVVEGWGRGASLFLSSKASLGLHIGLVCTAPVFTLPNVQSFNKTALQDCVNRTISSSYQTETRFFASLSPHPYTITLCALKSFGVILTFYFLSRFDHYDVLLLKTNELRGMAWAKLLDVDCRRDLEDFRDRLETPHAMTDQIQRDVDRSLTHFEHVRR